ncbi:MAG: extensin family protein [Erythrobacter sp.]
MPRKSRQSRAKREAGTFRIEARLIIVAIIAMIGFAGWVWLEGHPEHNPMAPLDLRDPIGMATARKIAVLKDDVTACHAALERSEVAYTVSPPLADASGEGACARPDRTQLDSFPMGPTNPSVTCPVAAGMVMWKAKSVAPAAQEIMGSNIARIEHLGTYNCRRMRGSGSSGWSQHATANAIDIAAFVLDDGTRISVLDDWDGGDAKSQFLRRVRDDACGVFATVLSPDFNAAHADHFHFDQSARWSGVCR